METGIPLAHFLPLSIYPLSLAYMWQELADWSRLA